MISAYFNNWNINCSSLLVSLFPVFSSRSYSSCHFSGESSFNSALAVIILGVGHYSSCSNVDILRSLGTTCTTNSVPIQCSYSQILTNYNQVCAWSQKTYCNPGRLWIQQDQCQSDRNSVLFDCFKWPFFHNCHNFHFSVWKHVDCFISHLHSR